MKSLTHQMILASAGSGKTYALTNRFVQLLAGGAAPERIVALTFTRKAAGEFFDEILNKLARAASDAARRACAWCTVLKLIDHGGRYSILPRRLCELLIFVTLQLSHGNGATLRSAACNVVNTHCYPGGVPCMHARRRSSTSRSSDSFRAS